MNTGLWAVHVEGPDDVIAVDSLESAHKLADMINKSQAHLIESAPEDKRDLYLNVQASVITCDWDAEIHAKEVERNKDLI